MNIHLSPPSRDNLGRHGVVARITTDDGGWHGVYRFQTHGMTAEEVAAERDRIEAWHSRKAAKLTELESLIGGTIHNFTITDATVRDRGHGCEVICSARSGVIVVEHREFFDDPAHVPAATSIAATMVDRVKTHESLSDTHEAHLSSVRAALGLS